MAKKRTTSTKGTKREIVTIEDLRDRLKSYTFKEMLDSLIEYAESDLDEILDNVRTQEQHSTVVAYDASICKRIAAKAYYLRRYATSLIIQENGNLDPSLADMLIFDNHEEIRERYERVREDCRRKKRRSLIIEDDEEDLPGLYMDDDEDMAGLSMEE